MTEFVEDTELDEYEYALDRTGCPAVSKTQSEIFGDYFRDLSANYSDYANGYKPWPLRPEGLQIIEPLDDQELARA
jgi:hypothetical protein